MIDRRVFVSLLAYTVARKTLVGQTRLETAKEFVDATRKYADSVGKYLANQDMLDIALKVLLRADEVGNTFRTYQHLHFETVASLQNRADELLRAPELMRGSREQLRARYEALKIIIRERYEASWIPTNLDKQQQDLADAFANAAVELEQLSRTGRTPAARESQPSNCLSTKRPVD